MTISDFLLRYESEISYSEEEQVGPFIHDLRSIEKNIEYPLEDGTEGFYIDHGNDYSPFFTQQGYKTGFLYYK